MNLYEKMYSAYDRLDTETYLECFHEDYEMIRHSTGEKITLKDFHFDQLATVMTGSKIKNRRCVYENEDIMIVHGIATYFNGSREAVMAVYLKKDGLVWRHETGATPLKPQEEH